MQNTITLKIENGSWMAIFSGPHAAHVQDLFGTKTIPTPFLAAAGEDIVRNSIADLNPGVDIVLG